MRLAPIAGIGLYSGLMLVPKVLPAVAGTAVFFAYVLTIPIAIAGLGICFLWGLFGAALSFLRGVPATQRHRALIVIPVIGVVMLGAVWWISISVDGRLPSGSHLLEFDPIAWKNSGSADYVQGEITIRQEMLGSAVARLNGALGREDVEALLGPPTDTRYFEYLGWDLIYFLGRQRDSIVAIDDEWLLIWLDDSGRFERYRVVHD